MKAHEVLIDAAISENLVKAFYTIYNRMDTGIAYNSNITICAAEQETADEYGNILAEM